MMPDDRGQRSHGRLVASIVTPPGQGAISTVRVDGAETVAAVQKCFLPSGRAGLEQSEAGRIIYGRWGSPTGEEIVVSRGDLGSVEIHCHGGSQAARAIIEDLQDHGAEVIEWREWITSQESDPLVAQALLALSAAPSTRTAAILLDQYEGALRRELDHAVAALTAGDLQTSGQRIDRLLVHRRVGLHLTVPFRVVLAGRPNVGKSSLINRLVGFQRAIVFDSPGTTRDVLTAGTCLDGWPVQLSDTAGLRDSGDRLEADGVRRARTLLTAADLIVLVFDASTAWTTEDSELARQYPAAMVVHNKRDLPPGNAAAPPPGSSTSATTGAGIETLIADILGRLVPNSPPPGAAVPFTAEQFALLDRAAGAISRGDGDPALAALSDFALAAC